MNTQNKIKIVAFREYTRNIRKVSFWLATLFFPFFTIIIAAISGYSNQAAQDRIKEDIEGAKKIYVYDESGLINDKLLQSPLIKITNINDALDEVKNNKADGLISIPKDILNSGRVEISQQAKGIFSNGRYNDTASKLLKQSLLLELNDPAKIKFVNGDVNFITTSFQDGKVVDESFEKLIIPIASVVIYFILVNFANSYLLSSVAEEKENRMIEVVLTSITSKDLIIGKILGQLMSVLTQLFVLILLATIGIAAARIALPIDISKINVNWWIVAQSIVYIIIGFLILGNIMVGVGAAMPNYRDAQSFSSVFIILSILPVYFFTIILADPNGTVSLIASYFPLTAPMILMFRNALGVLSLQESLISLVVILLYLIASFWLAIRLFEFGALQYNQRISFKNFLSSLSKK